MGVWLALGEERHSLVERGGSRGFTPRLAGVSLCNIIYGKEVMKIKISPLHAKAIINISSDALLH